MKKLIKIIFGIALVVLTAYFLFGKSNNTSYKIPDISLDRSNIISVASTTAENIKNKTKDIFSGIVSGVASDLKTKSEEIVSSAVEKTKDYVFNAFKQGVESGVNKLGESAGITVNSPKNPVNVIYSIKKGESAYFTVKNSEDEELNYEVDWLDGKKDSGRLSQRDKSVVLSHKWADAGEYSTTFKVVDSKGEKEYKILIAVID